MAVFPTSPTPRVNSTRAKRLPSIRTESEGGYGQTRKQFTKMRPRYKLNFDNISHAEYNTLEAFFLANQGTIFTFTHPIELVSYDVMFNQDEIEANDFEYGRCNTSIELIGV